MKTLSAIAIISIIALSIPSYAANNISAVTVVSNLCEDMSRNAALMYRGAIKFIAPSYLEKYSLPPDQCTSDAYAFSKYAFISSNNSDAIVVKCINAENYWAVDLTFRTVEENGQWYIYPGSHEAQAASFFGPAHISITPWVSAKKDVPIDIIPDWNAMYKDAIAKHQSSFVSKAIGDKVPILLKSGTRYMGTIDAIRDNEAEFTLPAGKMTIPRTSMAEQSRVMLWADDYARSTAKQEVMKAQSAFRSKVEDDKKRHIESASQATAQFYKDTTKLVLVDWNWRHEHGFVIAEGMVRNVTQQPMRNICADVTFLTSGGEFVTSEDSLVSYNPILPNQTSPFRVMASDNPEIRKARIGFKELFGGSVDHLTEERYKELISGGK